MKKLKRLTFAQLGEFERLSPLEMMLMLGGTGCCWDVMAEAYKRMYASELSAGLSVPGFSPSYFKEKWSEYMGAKTDKSGDPLLEQSGDLFNFMKTYFFKTTTDNWDSDIISQIISSGAQNWGNQALVFAVVSGNGNDDHAVLITGAKNSEEITYWDPATGKEATAPKSKFKYGTGLCRNEKSGSEAK